MGGTQNLMLNCITEMNRRGIESHLCTLAAREKSHARDQLPVQSVHLDFEGDYRCPLAVRRCVKKLSVLFQQIEPDIVHSYLWLSDFVTAVANRKRSFPHLSHVVDRRNWQTSRALKHQFRRCLTQRMFRRSGTRFLAVSQAARQFAVETLHIDPRWIAVAYNSVDVHCYQNIPPAPLLTGDAPEFTLGTASRLEPEKGHVYLLQAISLLRCRGFPVKLLITGEGSHRQELERRAGKLGLSTCVRFVGWVDNIADFFRTIDLFLVPSIDSEGLPTTILEAMASGRVVVATDVGGAAEAIRDTVDGRVVPARDPDALAVAVVSVTENLSTYQNMAESARHRVRGLFSITHMADVIAKTYSEMCGRPL